MKDKLHILILGGTGVMGKHLVHVLNEDKHQVVVTSRKPHDNYENIEYRMGNAQDMEWLKSVLYEREWDAIVDFMRYSTGEFADRVEEYLSATKQYVYLSSSRVYADTGLERLTEDSPRLLDVCHDKSYLQTDEYALAKAREEDMLINNRRKNWTIIRPYITFSEQRLQLGCMEKEQWLIPALHDRPIVLSKDIVNCRTTITSGLSVAKCIASILNRKEAYGETFHIATHESFKWSEILQWYIDVIKQVKGKEPTIFYTERWDATFGGGYYQVLYDRLYNRQFDNSKICKFVSDEAFDMTETSLKESTRIFIESYNANISDLNQQTELQRGILTGKYLPLRSIAGKRNKIKTLLYKLHIAKPFKTIYHIWN